MDVLLENFLNHHPDHAARMLGAASSNTFLDLAQDYPESVEKIISNLSPSYVAKVFEEDLERAVELICPQIRATYIATILRLIPFHKRDNILSALEPEKNKAASELLQYTSLQVGYYLEKTELVLNENITPQAAIQAIENITTLQHPIYVVGSNYTLKGALDLFKLIKMRDESKSSLKMAINKKIISVKGSTALRNIISHPGWDTNTIFPVVGQSHCLLGVISKSAISFCQEEMNETDNPRTSLNEYIYFSELLWRGLQKFWGSLR